MKTNFDFLKDIDSELFNIIEDAQELFCDEYFNQAAIQVRIFGEKMTKQVLGAQSSGLTFDDALNCLKDKIKQEREKEFIDDLFFIKREGNKCAHGEDIEASQTLELFERAFEASINYAYSKTKDEKINKLQFDKTLLITGKTQKESGLADKFIQAAQKEIEQSEEKKKEKTIPASKTKRLPSPKKLKVKEKIKEARKNLKKEINKPKRKPTKKQLKLKQEQKDKIIRLIIFISFVTISLIFITKMLVFY